MSTAHIKSLKVVKETSFGSLDTATNLPDSTIFAGGLYIEAERADLGTPGDLAMNERAETRSQFYVLPGEPETVLDGSGNVVQRRTGTLVFTTTMRGGGNFNALGGGYDNSVVDLLLNSATYTAGSPALAAGYTDLVAGPIGANSFTPTDATKYRIGDIIAVDIDGRREYTAVTDIDNGAPSVSYSPQLSRALTNASGDVVRTCCTYSGDLGNVGDSVAFQVEGDGWLSRCYGCRWESLEFSLTGRRLMATWTFQCALIQDDHASSSPGDPNRLLGKVAHFFPSDVILSDAVPQPVISTPATVPFALAQAVVANVDEFSATITHTLSPKGYSRSILGMSDWEVTDRVVAVNLTLSTPTAVITDDFRNQVQRSLVIGFGPTGAGNGMCLYLPSAVLQTDPDQRDVGGDLIRQVLTYGAGLWLGDDSSMHSGNTNVRIGLSH